jgi:hypothetical protein
MAHLISGKVNGVISNFADYSYYSVYIIVTEYDHCWAKTQYTRSSNHEIIGAVFSVGHATTSC